jgi:hypothetical protein
MRAAGDRFDERQGRAPVARFLPQRRVLLDETKPCDDITLFDIIAVDALIPWVIGHAR